MSSSRLGETVGGSAPAQHGGPARGCRPPSPGRCGSGKPGLGTPAGAGPAGCALGVEGGPAPARPLGVVATKGNESKEAAPKRGTFDSVVVLVSGGFSTPQSEIFDLFETFVAQYGMTTLMPAFYKSFPFFSM